MKEKRKFDKTRGSEDWTQFIQNELNFFNWNAKIKYLKEKLGSKKD